MFSLKTRTHLLLGRLAAVAFPTLTREVRAGDVGGPKERMKHLIARSELKRLHAKGNGTVVQEALTRRWAAENLQPDYYDQYADRFDDMFNGPHAPIVDWLKEFAAQSGVTHVIEVGCGDGRALASMAQKIPEIPRWTGVDINTDIIARNVQTFAGSDTLTFVAADADEWLAENLEEGALLMTYGGVMEYIEPKALTRWFDLLMAKGGAGVLLTEPADRSHDMETNPTSYIWGRESSYSHNHKVLLEASGFEVLKSDEAVTWESNFRWIMMLAASKPTSGS